MKNIIVTGGAGFIGSHLVEELLNQNNRVLVFDNFYTGAKENLNLDHPNLTLINHDITNQFGNSEKFIIENIFESNQVDEIYNLACPASPFHYQSDPIYTTLVSVVGTLNVLQLAEYYNAKILHASTSEVYGDPHVHPQPESYWGNVNPHGVRSCYDEGKRCAESLCFDFYRKHGVKIKVVRIFNTYGPRMLQNDGRVISNFCVQVLNKNPITIYGSGSQTRSFCYVSDLVEGLIKMMENTPDTFVGPVNLGNHEEITIRQLAEKVKTEAEKYGIFDVKFAYQSLPADDPKQRKPDISLADQILNWRPKTDLNIGLEKTFKYFYNVQNK